jgi:glycosyltransferase involved in cell wall biosynthesis
MKLNIIHITPDFNYACGRSYYVYLLLKYQSRKHRVILLTDKGDSFDRLTDLNINFIRIRNLHSKNPVAFANNVRLILSLVKSFQAQILHTHHRYSEFLAVNAKKLLRNRFLTIFTSLSIVNRKYNVEYQSDRIIAVSKTIRNMLINRFKVDRNKISLIPNFTDTDEINELELLSPFVSDDYHGYTLLAIGRFHRDKNFEIILRAMKALNEKRLRLLLVGEGELYDTYRQYIDEYNLNVEIHKPSRNLLQYFLTANICILPSVREPFPNFMLQSGLHRKPFIGANVDGISELIVDGHNGLLFRSNDHMELAEKILLFRQDRKLALRCANNLYKDIVNHYTQEFIIPEIEKLYFSLLKD